MKLPVRYKGMVYLLGLLVVVPVLVWNVSLSKTAGIAAKYRKSQRELAVLEQRTAPADTTARIHIDPTEQIESGLLLNALQTVADAQRVKIEHYTPYVSDRKGDLTVRTAEVTMSGRYIPLLRVVEAVEDTFAECRLLSVTFRAVRDRRNKTKELKMVMLIQQVMQNK